MQQLSNIFIRQHPCLLFIVLFTLNILDDETSYIEFSQAVYYGSDDTPNQVEINLTRSGDVNNIADVEVLFKDGTATEGMDFNGFYGMTQWVNFS